MYAFTINFRDVRSIACSPCFPQHFTSQSAEKFDSMPTAFVSHRLLLPVPFSRKIIGSRSMFAYHPCFTQLITFRSIAYSFNFPQRPGGVPTAFAACCPTFGRVADQKRIRKRKGPSSLVDRYGQARVRRGEDGSPRGS